MGGVISNLIGTQLGTKMQKAQEEAQQIGQQLQMYSYLLQDPGAPPPLKQAAHGSLLDLAEEHGGKDVDRQQLGQYLTQLAAPSLIKQALQQRAAQAQAQGQGGRFGSQFRRYYVEPEQEQANPATTPATSESTPSGRTSAVPFDARMEDIMAQATPGEPASPPPMQATRPFDPNAVTPGLTGRPYVGEPPAPELGPASPAARPAPAARAAAAAPAAVPHKPSFRERLGNILTGFAYGMHGQVPPERMQQIQLAGQRQEMMQRLQAVDEAEKRGWMDGPQANEARRYIISGGERLTAQAAAKTRFVPGTVAGTNQQLIEFFHENDLGEPDPNRSYRLEINPATNRITNAYETAGARPRRVLISGRDPAMQEYARNHPEFQLDPNQSYDAGMDDQGTIVHANIPGTKPLSAQDRTELGQFVRALKSLNPNLKPEEVEAKAGEMWLQQKGYRLAPIILRTEIQSLLSGLPVPTPFQTGPAGVQPVQPQPAGAGGTQPAAPATPATPATPVRAAPSIGAAAERSPTGALLPAPAGSTPGVERTADGQTKNVWFGPDGRRYELGPEPIITPGGQIQKPSGQAPSGQAAPSARTAGSMTEQERRSVDLYLNTITAVGPRGGGAAASVGALAGQQILEARTGLDPGSINQEGVQWRARSDQLRASEQQIGALDRITRTIDKFGNRLIENGQKVVDKKSPFLNRLYRDIKLATVGDPALRQYLIDLNELQREYGILTAGGAQSKAMLPVSVTEKMDKVIEGNMPLRDVIATVQEIQITSKNSIDAGKEQQYDLKKQQAESPIGQALGMKLPPPPPSLLRTGPMPKTADELRKMLGR